MKACRDRISVTPALFHGKASMRGTRIPVAVLLDNVVAGVPREEILRGYPALTPWDLDAALVHAAEPAREETVELPLEVGA